MEHFGLLNTVARGKSDDWQGGDILFIKTPNECKAKWDEMLQNGRVTQVEYDASILPSGAHVWPYGTLEKTIHQAFMIDDTISKSELRAMVEEELTISGFDELGAEIYKIKQRRKQKIDLDKLGYSQNKLSQIRSKTYTVTTQTLTKANIETKVAK